MTRPNRSPSKDSRIQTAIGGLLIPLTSVVAVYGHAEALIAAGASDLALASGLREFVGRL